MEIEVDTTRYDPMDAQRFNPLLRTSTVSISVPFISFLCIFSTPRSPPFPFSENQLAF
jgi:hypothetical protein